MVAVFGGEGCQQFTTADAALTVALEPAGSALYVQRIWRRPIGAHVSAAMLFASPDDFTRWLDADPLRLEDPGLLERVRHCAQDHFAQWEHSHENA